MNPFESPADFIERFLALESEENAGDPLEIQPWQQRLLDDIERAGDRPLQLLDVTRARGRRLAHRCVIEGLLLEAVSSEIVDDDLHVTLEDGASCLLVGAGRLLIEELHAEAERALKN